MYKFCFFLTLSFIVLNFETAFGIKLINPLGNKDLVSFLLLIIDSILKIAEIIIFLMIFFIGFKYVTEQDSSKRSSLHKHFLWLFIGGMLILGAHGIFLLIQSTALEITR